MSVTQKAVMCSLALLVIAGSASAQYGYNVQGPQPGMSTAPVGNSYATAGPQDPYMGMGPTSYGGPSYTGQQNYPAQQPMAPPASSLLSYGQLEVDYLRTTYDNKKFAASDGASVSLMAKLFDPFFLHVQVDLGSGTSSRSSAQSYNFSTIHVGGGGYIPISDRFHLTGEVGMLYAHMDSTRTSAGFSDGAIYMMPGVRFMATDSLELDGHLTATSADKYDSFIFDLGGYYKLFSQMDLGLDVGFGDQSTTYRAGIRFRW